jgi:hypothetical protein
MSAPKAKLLLGLSVEDAGAGLSVKLEVSPRSHYLLVVCTTEEDAGLESAVAREETLV